jgi:hypothetical protein
MGNNILDLSNIESGDLIKELESRGFKTNLLYNRHDVDLQLSIINDYRGDDYQISSDDLDPDQILDEVFESITEYVCERINDSIQDKILSYV